MEQATAPTEHDQIERWRRDELVRAGYGRRLARTLAERLDIDLHRALDLVDCGCDPELAARILL
jgi:hypothetical protein